MVAIRGLGHPYRTRPREELWTGYMLYPNEIPKISGWL